MSSSVENAAPSRREFLKSSSAVAVGGAVATLAAATPVHAAGSDLLKVGLVGCGGRGSGAAAQAVSADPHCELVAMADAFQEQIDKSLSSLKADNKIGNRVTVTGDHQFVGLDGYKHLIDMCDVVLLASPPGFRPAHLRAAVEANKQIFTEKPMATDAPGARSVFQSVELSKQKKLAMVAGFCWRYDNAKRELFRRIHDGDIGEVRAAYGTYLTNPVKPMPAANTRPPKMSDLEWQVRNWYNFTWLSGDGLVEQAIHTVDWLCWVFKDAPPVSCTAVGGRQIPQEGGDIYDHVEVNYLWDQDSRAFLSQRQIPGCHNENSLSVLGTKGTALISGRGVSINDLSGKTVWKYSGPANNMYQTEHDEFFASIRSGKYINDGDRMAKSTLAGIMGRMAGYTGQQVTWDMALNSQLNLFPDLSQGWNSKVESLPIPRPGVTQFV
jgi:predicted dehydrogenase